MLKKIILIDKKSAILIVERNLKIVPDLDLKLFILKLMMAGRFMILVFGILDIQK